LDASANTATAVLYARRWRSLKWRTRLLVGAFACWFALPYPAARWGKDPTWGGWVLAFALSVIAATTMASLRCALFRCPRCQKTFFSEWPSRRNTFARHCLHCGLPKWAKAPVE
jgi:hypothetical protein